MLLNIIVRGTDITVLLTRITSPDCYKLWRKNKIVFATLSQGPEDVSSRPLINVVTTRRHQNSNSYKVIIRLYH
jgi:hypothetical protein